MGQSVHTGPTRGLPTASLSSLLLAFCISYPKSGKTEFSKYAADLRLDLTFYTQN